METASADENGLLSALCWRRQEIYHHICFYRCITLKEVEFLKLLNYAFLDVIVEIHKYLQMIFKQINYNLKLCLTTNQIASRL